MGPSQDVFEDVEIGRFVEQQNDPIQRNLVDEFSELICDAPILRGKARKVHDDDVGPIEQMLESLFPGGVGALHRIDRKAKHAVGPRRKSFERFAQFRRIARDRTIDPACKIVEQVFCLVPGGIGTIEKLACADPLPRVAEIEEIREIGAAEDPQRQQIQRRLIGILALHTGCAPVNPVKVPQHAGEGDRDENQRQRRGKRGVGDRGSEQRNSNQKVPNRRRAKGRIDSVASSTSCGATLTLTSTPGVTAARRAAFRRPRSQGTAFGLKSASVARRAPAMNHGVRSEKCTPPSEKKSGAGPASQ